MEEGDKEYVAKPLSPLPQIRTYTHMARYLPSHPPDTIYVRQVTEAETKPKA